MEGGGVLEKVWINPTSVFLDTSLEANLPGSICSAVGVGLKLTTQKGD